MVRPLSQPLPNKGGRHIFTILRNFDPQFIENTSTYEFYGITIVKCPFVYKQKSRTWRRFVHRYESFMETTDTNLGIKYVHVVMTWVGAGDNHPLSPFCWPAACYFDKILWAVKTKLSSPQTSDSSCCSLATGHWDSDYHKIIWTQPLMSHWPVQGMSHLRIWNVMQSPDQSNIRPIRGQ